MPLEQARALAELCELWRDNRGAAQEVFEQWTAVREVEKAKYLARDREIKEAHRPPPVQLSLTAQGGVPWVYADEVVVPGVEWWPDGPLPLPPTWQPSAWRHSRPITVRGPGRQGWWLNSKQTGTASTRA